MRDWLTNAIVIGLSAVLLSHFCMIAIHGSFLIREPNIIILSSEITGLLAILSFAVVNMIRIWRMRHRH